MTHGGSIFTSAKVQSLASAPNHTTFASTIYEYAHGGTEPIAALSDSGTAYGCSIDPATGNLAVANGYDTSNPYLANYGSLAIYTSAQGNPSVYYSSALAVTSCSYNAEGHLYLSAYNTRQEKNGLAQFSQETHTFKQLKLDVNISSEELSVVQWDGENMTISSYAGLGAPVLVYRLQISGSNARVISTTSLESARNHHNGQTWIEGKRIIGFATLKGANNIDEWAYPSGGNPEQQIKKAVEVGSGGYLSGIVISPGSSR